ncbi:sensor histidine kinase [Azospira inquinata]|uniref:histidine kinase n=1 Tax=Azospira inquinata TaxID=2785627 RepID=A0A975SLI6_9RHOO|nr:HAMP domain-containing sensor histidine kinase [Azospira inquinata]QWT46568.1 HAMP domain-containing histidine kinase [Azospira inquinata]QWT48110.1 HAMP domain-containing histidine kinase [Azospira inquinata]
MDSKEPTPDLSAFLVSAVHDMKNSISVLVDRMEKLLDEADPDRPEYADLTHMMYETKRINGNLIQLLALYKLGNHLYPFAPEDWVVGEFLEEVLSQHHPLFRFKHISVTQEVPEELVWPFDGDLVGGILSHALNNASHYTRSRVRLTAQSGPEGLELRVEDDGQGYPQRMLDEGVAAMQGVDFQGGSTGLGLYFAAMAARLHRNKGRHGTIRLENGGAWGGGCFVLTLP